MNLWLFHKWSNREQQRVGGPIENRVRSASRPGVNYFWDNISTDLYQNSHFNFDGISHDCKGGAATPPANVTMAVKRTVGTTFKSQPKVRYSNIRDRGRTAIPQKLRRKILNRDRGCTHKTLGTERACGSRWQLEIDHIHPIWAGGGNEESNLRSLCRAHNQYRYAEQSGVKTMAMGKAL